MIFAPLPFPRLTALFLITYNPVHRGWKSLLVCLQCRQEQNKREPFLHSSQTRTSPLSQNGKCWYDAYRRKLTFLSGRSVSYRSGAVPRGFLSSVCMVETKHNVAKRLRLYLLLSKNMKNKAGFASIMSDSLSPLIRLQVNGQDA